MKIKQTDIYLAFDVHDFIFSLNLYIRSIQIGKNFVTINETRVSVCNLSERYIYLSVIILIKIPLNTNK